MYVHCVSSHSLYTFTTSHSHDAPDHQRNEEQLVHTLSVIMDLRAALAPCKVISFFIFYFFPQEWEQRATRTATWPVRPGSWVTRRASTWPPTLTSQLSEASREHQPHPAMSSPTTSRRPPNAVFLVPPELFSIVTDAAPHCIYRCSSVSPENRPFLKT